MIASEEKPAKEFFSAASKKANRRFLILQTVFPICTQFFAAKSARNKEKQVALPREALS
jgi:hypothetical protein